MRLAETVGRVMAEMIQRDEAEGTVNGREAVAQGLLAFARRVRQYRPSADVTELALLADDIREGRVR